MVFSIYPENHFLFTRNIPAALHRYLLPVSSRASAAVHEKVEMQFDLHSLHEGGREYITLSLQYDRSTLEEWSSYFPPLVPFLEKVEASQPAILLHGNRWMNRDIQDTIHRLTHIPLDTPGYRAYFDLMTRTLLFYLLLQAAQEQPASTFNHYEVEGIYAAREMIRQNIRRHFVIREIAQKVGVNEFKLKNGFRELFGNGVYEYLRLERLQEARELLHAPTRSIKEIAAQTGYKSVNSFIKAFKKESV